MTETAVDDIRGWEPTPDVIAAEEQVLGAALSAPVADDLPLEAEDFWRPAHRHVWSAVRTLTERGDPVDVASVARELQAEVDGARQIGQVHELLFRLYSGLITASNVTYHAETVREAARLRRLYEAGIYLQQLGSSPGDVDGKLDRARERLAAVEDGSGRAGIRHLSALLGETLDRVEGGTQAGLHTGLMDLDEILGPLLPGQLTLIGARPGVGKSSLLLSLARNISQEPDVDGDVAVCSLEMSEDEISKRLLASTGVDLKALMRNDLDEVQWGRAAKGLQLLSDLPLYVDDAEDVTLADLRALTRRRRLRLLIVDYAQLMRAPKADTRQAEVAALSRGLKLLAKAAQIPLVVACQLNRNSETRGDKRPHMSDLRESGTWEQDADNVLLLHRDPEKPGEMEIDVAKQRNGPTGTATVGWQGPYSRVVNLAGRWQT